MEYTIQEGKQTPISDHRCRPGLASGSVSSSTALLSPRTSKSAKSAFSSWIYLYRIGLTKNQ